ncbi:FAD binding domain-containing protein [Novosphingobium sp. 9]|uniref:FAD binding domain-containing protein n=1 Tax=Novosphingobium sp. 9 TaxID=2025349 RepID=UPI0021B50CD1|nr:FAD binding domain-containing protein [Novosphingobium sp. 9]
MKPAPFDYLRAGHIDEALDLLRREGGDARVIAGGQSLLPMLNMRLARPKVLLDVMHVPELAEVREERGSLRIGAGVRQAQVLGIENLARRQPLLAAGLSWVGHAQTRARGTVCGSIAHADPSAELPLTLLTLGGEVHLRTAKKRRTLAAADFMTGMMATAKADDEMIEAVSIPLARSGTGYAFNEIGRRHGDFAIVACAAMVDETRTVLGIGGVADMPARRELPLPDAPDFADALNQFAWELDARDDLHASARYRRDLVRQMGARTIEEAARCRA